MREVRRNQLALITIVIALFLVSILLVVNLNNFVAPIGPKINPATGNNPEPSSSSDGLLLITVEANLTVLPSSTSSFEVGSGGFVNSPVRGVYISVTNAANDSDTLNNLTNSFGQLAVYLRPATYDVSFLDWRLNNSAVSVQVYAGQVTHLSSYVNATTFPVQSFNIVDPDSSGWALSWGQMYALVPSAQNITDINSSTFLETGTLSPISYLSSGTPSGLTRVSIIGSLASQNSQWVKVQVESPISIATIHGLRLLSITTKYLVSTG